MDMSESVANFRPQPPKLWKMAFLVDQRSWGYNRSIRDSIKAMEVLHDTMTLTLSKGFATIDETPLADPEFAGFSHPSVPVGRARDC